MAAPIFNELGDVIAAISVAGPTVRMSEERLAHISKSVVRATAEILKNLS